MSKYSCFDIKTKDHICSLVLNRPNELNTMTRDFWVELGDALEEINRDSDVRVVILSSTGKHFCAGMDLGAFSNGVDDIDIESCIKEASNKTISHLNYSPIKTEKYLICFSPEAFLTIINAFSSMFNARSILDGVSLSNKNSIGEKLSTEALNIYDDGLHEKNISSSPFDGEGTPTKRLCLINKGKIKNFIHSESTARIFKTIPTGHAGLGSKVSVSPDWIVVEKSEENIDLKTSLDHSTYEGEFVYIEELNAIHAGVRASQGSFSLPFDGWLYKNGTKISIESATVAGDIKYLLKNIVNIESNQEVTTSGISPHIWVDELSITGDA